MNDDTFSIPRSSYTLDKPELRTKVLISECGI